MNNVISPTPDAPCVADWDSTSYTSGTPHCLRRTDTNLKYPTDLNGAVHHDGMIWSRALWDIRNALGHAKADTIILEGHFGQRDPTMPELAETTVAAARRLYGTAAANAVHDAFKARGILYGTQAGGAPLGALLRLYGNARSDPKNALARHRSAAGGQLAWPGGSRRMTSEGGEGGVS